MSKKAKKSKAISVKEINYVYEIGDGTLNSSLMTEGNDHFEKVAEHPEMKCFDHRGHLISLSMLEVPEYLIPQLLKRRTKGDFDFRHFVGYGKETPSERLPGELGEEAAKKASIGIKEVKWQLKELKDKRKRKLVKLS